eukprot:g69711.t1
MSKCPCIPFQLRHSDPIVIQLRKDSCKCSYLRSIHNAYIERILALVSSCVAFITISCIPSIRRRQTLYSNRAATYVKLKKGAGQGEEVEVREVEGKQGAGVELGAGHREEVLVPGNPVLQESCSSSATSSCPTFCFLLALSLEISSESALSCDITFFSQDSR